MLSLSCSKEHKNVILAGNFLRNSYRSGKFWINVLFSWELARRLAFHFEHVKDLKSSSGSTLISDTGILLSQSIHYAYIPNVILSRP